MNLNDLNFFLVYHPLPKEVIDTFKNLDEQHIDVFVHQPSGKRRYTSLQNHRDKPFYKQELLNELKRSVANAMGLDYNDYVEVRDSIGINDTGVGILPHTDMVERWHVNTDISNCNKRDILFEWLQENNNLGSGISSNFVQMRCNFFIIEPEAGQHAWVEEKVLEIPRGGYGAAFDSGKLHGTTPGTSKKMTISLGYLLKKETFRSLVLKNYKPEHKVYVDTNYMQGNYPG
jgi:hypothetical protein